MSPGMAVTLFTTIRKSFLVILFLYSVSFFLVSTAKAQQADQTQIEYMSPAGVKYFLYLPKGYNASLSTFPLLVYLHGGGDITGTYDINALLTSPHTAPPWLINKNKWPDNPFIVLSPLLKKDPAVPNVNDQQWPMDVVDGIVELIKTTYKVNPSKIYFTGMSLGGSATWKYAGAFPAKVAGIVPFSGNTIKGDACTFTGIPVWVFHGLEDLTVNVHQTTDMVKLINDCPSGKYKPHANLLFGRLHEGWNEVYDGSMGYDIYTWLLQFSKTDVDNKPPYVNAGGDLRILQRSGSFHITGEYFDADGSISSVLWTKISGPAIPLSNTNDRFLQFDNLIEGDYIFRLTVTDNSNNTAWDEVSIKILAASSDPGIGDISLYDGAHKPNDVPSPDVKIISLSDNMIINKNLIGAADYNIVATNNTNGNWIRFSANTDRLTKDAVQPSASLYQQSQYPELTFPVVDIYNIGKYDVGTYNVCATGYSGSPYNIDPNTRGLTQCFKISIYDQPVKDFYPKPSMDIGSVTSWGTNTNGTGTPPGSFNDNFANFNIDKAVVLNSPLSLGGVQSNLYVKNGGQLTVNAALGATISTEGNAVVNVNTPQPINFGTLASTSTVNFDQNATTIPQVNYGNLMVSGSGSTKTLAAGTTTVVAGNLTIADNVTLQGNGNASVLSLGGNLTINEDGEFNPATRFGLQLTGASQLITVASTKVSFSQLTVGTGGAELKTSGPPTTLEVGSSTGGGLFINTGGNFILNNHNLIVSQAGSLNSAGQTGTLAIVDGTLTFSSSTTLSSNLYLAPGFNSVQTLTADLSGAGGALSVQSPALITDFIKSKNGTIHSNGNIALISTQDKTARVEQIEGTGNIEGLVEFQRYVFGTELYKYMSFPVSSVMVSDFQSFIPVSGKFDGASSNGVASLYSYDEAGGGWKRFPRASNTETFLPGQGYAVLMLQSTPQTTIKVKGSLIQNNFTLPLTGNGDGWNLVGNPYASPIQWGTGGWTSQNINATISVRSNAVSGGRFLSWDGTTGDAEFSGMIAQGQSVWVKATGSSPLLTIHESAKISSGNTILWRENQDQPVVDYLALEIKKDDRVEDRTFLKLNANATDKFDKQIDGVKQKNDNVNLSSLSNDSVSLVINNLSDTSCVKKINLLVSTKDPGTYSFSVQGTLLDKSVREFYLIDNYLNTKTVLTKDRNYNFTVATDAKTSGKRFQLEMRTIGKPVITMEGTVLKSNFQQGNQWLSNGQLIKEASGPTYEATQPGQYQVRVADGNCGVTSDNFTVSITSVPGSQPASHDVKLYPNPTKNIFHLQGWSQGQEDIQYSIVNLYGIKIQQGILSANDFSEGSDITLSENIQSGIYFLRLQSQHLNYTAKLSVE